MNHYFPFLKRKIVVSTFVCFMMFLTSGCEKCASDSDIPRADSPHAMANDIRPWNDPEVFSLLSPEKYPQTNLTLSTAETFAACHTVFEPFETPTSWPFNDASEQARFLYGCAPEAYEIRNDSSRYVAYRLPLQHEQSVPDLRIVAYSSTGAVLWHQRLVRGRLKINFDASFRGSFIAFPSNQLVCAGTLWEASTQVMCTDKKSGDVHWQGVMDFWAGIPPVGYEHSLFSADSSGITRRYPFNGAEMRHRPFHSAGGRAAYYAASNQQLYFAPFEDKPILAAYSFDDMQLRWQLQLPTTIIAGYGQAIDEHQLVIFKMESAIYGVHAKSGQALWALEVGDDHPVITHSPEALYVLLRAGSGPNYLYKIEPHQGIILQSSPTPLGTLHIHWQDDRLLLRSVRAVQELITTNLEEL